MQNEKLDKAIKNVASSELINRGLSESELIEIISNHDLLYIQRKDESLSYTYKLLLIILPFFWVIHGIIASRYLSRGQERKWKQYWLFLCIGILIWTFGIILWARYNLLPSVD